MEVNYTAVKPLQLTQSTRTVNFAASKPMAQCRADQLCLSTKAQKPSNVSFEGIFGNLFKTKADSRLIKEYQSLLKVDPMLNDTAQLSYKFGDFPEVHFTPGEKEYKFLLGFKNFRDDFIKKVEANVDAETCVITFKALDGLEYKAGDVKYAINCALRDAIWVYKNASSLSNKSHLADNNVNDVNSK